MSKLSLNDGKWKALVPQIKQRDEYRCTQCASEDDLTVDHIKPLASMTDEEIEEGLPYDEHNLITLCRTCNGRKQGRRVTRKTWFDSTWLDSL